MTCRRWRCDRRMGEMLDAHKNHFYFSCFFASFGCVRWPSDNTSKLSIIYAAWPLVMCWWCWFFGDKLSENGFNRIMNETRNEYERMEFIFADAFGVKSWFQLIWQSEWKCVDAASKWINLDFSSRGNSRSCLFDMWIAYTPHKRMNWCVCCFFFLSLFCCFSRKKCALNPYRQTHIHARARAHSTYTEIHASHGIIMAWHFAFQLRRLRLHHTKCIMLYYFSLGRKSNASTPTVKPRLSKNCEAR